MNLYLEVIFLSWGGRILHKVESLMVILFSGYLAYFSPLSSGGLNMLLFNSIIETYNKNFGKKNCHHQWRCKDNHLLFKIAQTEDDVGSVCKHIPWPVDEFL